MKTITPLMKFIHCLDARARTPGGHTINQKKAFAEDCGTTLFYLYQLGANPDPNPTMKLARSIVEASRVWGRRVGADSLTVDDLMVPALEIVDGVVQPAPEAKPHRAPAREAENG